MFFERGFIIGLAAYVSIFVLLFCVALYNSNQKFKLIQSQTSSMMEQIQKQHFEHIEQLKAIQSAYEKIISSR